MSINKQAGVGTPALTLTGGLNRMSKDIISFPGDPRQEPLWSSPFDKLRHVDENGIEFWLARELMTALGYTLWQNFKSVIKKARVACKKSGHEPDNHFGLLMSITQSGRGRNQNAVNYKLTRYACYLVAMNGDTAKQEVAEAQTYFAIQTRKSEVSAEKERERKQLKHKQDVTAYQLAGKSEDWSETRVAAKEATRIQNASIISAHETNEPNFGAISGEQNRALFDMSKREIVEYLGLLPKDADRYRDNLGRWANEAIRIAGKEIARKMGKLNRQLDDDEIVGIVTATSREVAKHARALADLDHVDYLSGAPLDENGNALIARNIRLLNSGD